MCCARAVRAAATFSLTRDSTAPWARRLSAEVARDYSNCQPPRALPPFMAVNLNFGRSTAIAACALCRFTEAQRTAAAWGSSIRDSGVGLLQRLLHALRLFGRAHVGQSRRVIANAQGYPPPCCPEGPEQAKRCALQISSAAHCTRHACKRTAQNHSRNNRNICDAMR